MPKNIRAIGFVFFPVSLLSIASLLFSFVAWAGVDASLSGTVMDDQQVSLPQIQVQLLKDQKVFKETITSQDGTYQFFPIQFGNYIILAKGKGFEPFQAELRVSSGENVSFPIQMKPEMSLESSMDDGAISPLLSGGESQGQEGEEMVLEVKAKKRLIQSTSSVSSTEISQNEIKRLPRGDQVSLPSLLTSTTPGAVGGTFGQIFFRGNHASIQYQVDGVQLPDSISNTFGQAFSTRNIEHMEVITGGIPAEYGQRLAAVVNIATKSGPERPTGEVQLNYGSYQTVSPYLTYGGSDSSGKLKYFLSLNYKSTLRGLDTPQPVSTKLSDQKQGGSDSVHNLGTGDNEFVRADWLVDNQNRLSFFVFHSRDNYQIPNYPSSFLSSDPYFQAGYTDVFGNQDEHGGPTYDYVPNQTNDYQSETNLYGQVIWKRILSENTFFQLAPYYKYSKLNYTPDPGNDLATTVVGGPYSIANAQPVSFSQDRFVNNLGIKGDYSYRPSTSHLLKTGFQVQASRTDGTVSIQTDLGQAPIKDRVDANGYFESAYIQDDIAVSPSLTLNLGLRFDATQFVFSDQSPTDSLLQPRLGFSYMLTEGTKWHGFYGKLFQPAGLENLRRTYTVVSHDPNSEPYDIKAEKDDYFETGFTQQFFNSQVARWVVFHKQGINVLDEAQLFRTSIAQPFNFATGYSYGTEFSIKGQLSRNWSEYLNYSYLIAKGKGISGGAWAADDHGGDGEQFMDHAQTHTVNGGLTYAKGAFWWTTQGLYGSGLRTGPSNSLGLPSHLTFDTTVGYEFKGKNWLSNFKVSADVVNIFDNRYPVTIANSFNGSHYASGRQFFIRLTKAI